MSTIISFKSVQATTAGDLDTAVNTEIANGYVVNGGISVSVSYNSNAATFESIYSIALVKYDDQPITNIEFLLISDNNITDFNTAINTAVSEGYVPNFSVNCAVAYDGTGTQFLVFAQAMVKYFTI